MKPFYLFAAVNLILIANATNCFAQNHYTKNKPALAEKDRIVKDKFCPDCFKLSSAQNYDSVLLGCWVWAHDEPSSITFNKDHTFAFGDCSEPANNIKIKGKYTLNGPDGWLIFNDGHKEQFYILYQINTKTQIWAYKLAIQYQSTNHFNYLEG